MKTKNVMAFGVIVAAVLVGMIFIMSSSASAAVVAGDSTSIVRPAINSSVFAPRPFIGARPFIAPRPFVRPIFNPFFFPRFNPFFFDDDLFFGFEEPEFGFERDFERDD